MPAGLLLDRHGVRAETHADRARWFGPGAFSEFTRIDRGDYLQLKRYSELARYLGVPFVWLQYASLRARAGQFVARWSGRVRQPDAPYLPSTGRAFFTTLPFPTLPLACKVQHDCWYSTRHGEDLSEGFDSCCPTCPGVGQAKAHAIPAALPSTEGSIA